MQHLLTIADLSDVELAALFKRARDIIIGQYHLNNELHSLKNRTVASLFYEPSTRTRCSFELASKRLNANFLDLALTTSSAVKGETLVDTVENLAAMGVNACVIRHGQAGILANLVAQLRLPISIINAGDGSNEHPTQALIDTFTILQHKPTFPELRIALVGDIGHSRVANSNLALWQRMGVRDIRLIAPKQFLPAATKDQNRTYFSDLAAGISDVDVIIALRIQRERMPVTDIPDTSTYLQQFGITQQVLRLAKPDAIVMHPGPVMRDEDIETAVINGSQSVILEQVTNGIAVRMAVLTELIGNQDGNVI